jgi:hemerythrin-like domain-containing protein
MAITVPRIFHAPGDPDMERARAAVSRAARGEAQVLELRVPPRPLLRRLLDENVLPRALLLLERDGLHGRVAIVPRRASGEVTIAELLEEDHRRLDEIADCMCRNVHIDRLRSVVLAHLFAAGMRRHLMAEEEILFPLYGGRLGPAGGPMPQLEREHRAMLHYVERVLCSAERVLDTRGRDEAIEDLLRAQRGLAAIVAEHGDREERCLFPMLDRTLDKAHRDEVLRRLVLF